MTPIKIECGCGQRYAFDVEPVNGQLASPVACPVCGADGTAAANRLIAESMAAQPVAGAGTGLRLSAGHAASPRPVSPIASAPPPLPPGAASGKLTWYEQIWIALPIALVAVGGAIGGGCGGLAWGINKAVFKKLKNPVLRYVVTGLISVAAVLVWLTTATFILALFRKH